jgi:hypothetical protein
MVEKGFALAFEDGSREVDASVSGSVTNDASEGSGNGSVEFVETRRREDPAGWGGKEIGVENIKKEVK